ncbi:DUF2269 domain-containing protein [Rhodobacteraceae bacterium N5(2021)]|uniref:DUF2269 domain-containing protein n=1 Tax=Gymnodinialimonas phycosphaerae TaxID=2841589 RepID=A0A975TYC5_9RHOB|nr:DUF2269 domain-containing protein [Gymnodinialimonas phycosphaerae]
MDPYLLAKWLHILSSTVLFGTGIGTAFQMVWAMRRADPHQVHGVASGLVIADWLFTTPAGLIQPATGLWLVWLAGWSLTEPWLLLTYGLYALAFVCWAPVVHLQIRIRDLAAQTACRGTALPPEAHRAFRIWFALGWPAFIALTVIFWLMVTKPPLWG